MKNILIIGGSYFTGRVFVEELLKQGGYNIFVFNRGNIPLNFKGVTELKGDREDQDRIRNTLPEKEWHAVVDFCAYTPDHIEKMIRSIHGTLHQYIFISTTAVYETTFDLPIKEDAAKVSKPQPELGPYADYGLNKWLAEISLRSEGEKRGIAYTCLRPAIIYGPYNYAPRESYFFDLLRDNKPMVVPKNELALYSFVSVLDAAKIILKCLGNEKALNETFNIAGEELISYPRLAQMLEVISGKKPKIIKMTLDEIRQMEIPLPFPPDSHLVYSGEKIRRVLDIEYTPFTEGMRETYKYYQMLQARK
jgi:nucleoside-diphosphate-sugar epimerase